MKANPRFPDITQRMMLFEKFFHFGKHEDWLELLGYADVSSVSRVINGSTGIPISAIRNICKASGITENVFRAPLWELAEALEVTDESGVDEILRNIDKHTHEISTVLFGEDQDIINNINGNYIMLYLGREDLNFEKKQIIAEKIEISQSDDLIKCKVSQISNFITGERAEGELISRGSRIYFSVQYSKTYYVRSNFLMHALFFSKDMKIFSGIYLDIAPTTMNQIFATQFCMFSVRDVEIYPRRYMMSDEIFTIWHDILESDTQGRGRIIARSGEEFSDMVRKAVRETIRKEEE